MAAERSEAVIGPTTRAEGNLVPIVNEVHSGVWR